MSTWHGTTTGGSALADAAVKAQAPAFVPDPAERGLRILAEMLEAAAAREPNVPERRPRSIAGIPVDASRIVRLVTNDRLQPVRDEEERR